MIDYESLRKEAAVKKPYRGQTKRQFRAPEPGEIEEILTSNIGRDSIHRTAGKELRFWPCPVCGFGKGNRDATSINVDTGLWFCFHCRAKGNTQSLMRAYGIQPSDDWFLPDPDAIDLPVARKMVAEHRKNTPHLISSGKYPDLLAYFNGRGISAKTLDAYHVVSNGPQCARWPLYFQDETGEWHEVNGRVRKCLDLESGGAKGWFEPTGAPTGIFIGQHLVSEENGKRLWIFEGEIDAMTGYEIGLRNCVSLPNGANTVQVGSLLRYIPEDWDIILAVDMDDAGKRCARTFYSQLGFERIERAMLPAKDLNQWLKDDPKITPGMVEDTIPGRKIATSINRMKIGGGAVKSKKDRIVTESPWPLLTTKLGGGLLSGQTTGILAPSGIGKTTFVNQWAIHAASKGIKTGLISLEGDRDELNHILTMAIAGWTGCAEESDGFKQIADDKLIVSALEGHTVDWRKCVDEFSGMIDLGAKLLILDNLDFIMPRGSAGSMDQKPLAYAALIELARTKHVHIIVVWQPNKVDRTRAVNSGNQKGLSQTFQDSDNYINLNVFGSCRKVEIEKCRHAGIAEGEHFVVLKYDGPRRCLDQVEGDAAALVGDGRGGMGNIPRLPGTNPKIIAMPSQTVAFASRVDDSPWVNDWMGVDLNG